MSVAEPTVAPDTCRSTILFDVTVLSLSVVVIAASVPPMVTSPEPFAESDGRTDATVTFPWLVMRPSSS